MTHLSLIGPAPHIAVEYDGTGPLLVFLHGIGGNRTNWREQLAAFAPRFTAAAWDARGYGDSDSCKGHLSFSDFAADLERVLDHFKAERAHLVGLSLGGMIALDFYRRCPQRVLSLVICNSAARFRDLFASEGDFEAYLSFRRKTSSQSQKLSDVAPSIARASLSTKASPGTYQRLADSLSAVGDDAYQKTLAASVLCDFSDVLPEISVPTLILTGEEDYLSTPDVSRQLAKRISGAELHIIKNAGHLSNFEQPNEFNRILTRFLGNRKFKPLFPPPRQP